MTGMSMGQSDVPGPEGQAAVARIPEKDGARFSGGEEDQWAAQQLGEEEEDYLHLLHRLYHVTWLLLVLLFSKSGGKTDFYFETASFVKETKFDTGATRTSNQLAAALERRTWCDFTREQGGWGQIPGDSNQIS